MPKLIIAEKPSLAKNIIIAIGTKKFQKHEGYYESGEYIVAPAFGHLFSLLDIEEYDDGYNPDDKHEWNLDELPFVPNPFRFGLKKDTKTKKVDKGVKKQYKVIESLIHRDDVSAIINAGDSDREGEIIIRIILDNAKNTKPVYRLWMPDQTPETINQELRNMTNDTEYDNLANEGLSRTYVDWLYGINLTRYASLKSHMLLRVGRVIAPIVKAIYDRDMEIENFTPEKYYGVVSKEITNGEEIELTSKKTFKNDDLAGAEDLCRKYNSVPAIVKSAKTEKKEIKPGKLYSLSKLEGVLGKKYKMSVSDSLAVVQTLYEAGYVTYPRTNTEYMATAEKDKVKGIIKALKEKGGFPVSFKDSKTIFDDSKIESHSALTPTTKIPDLNKLSEKERQVYETIRNRFVAVFCSEPCLVDRSVITIDVGDYETFTLKGDIMIQKGWTAFDFYDKKDKTLPALVEGDQINTNFKPTEKETTPPKHYTTESLNNYLKNPFKNENDEENEDEEYKAMLNGVELGTEATRPGIISNAISAKYISLKNDTYYILPDGKYYIETLEKLQIDMSKNKSVELSIVLKDIYKGTKTIQDSINITKEEMERIFAHKNDITIDAMTSKNLGDCPICGKPLKMQSWGLGCTGYKEGCKFSINGVIAGKKLTESQIKALIENGETNTIKGFKGKSGKKFDAKLKLVKNEGEGPQYKLQFVFEGDEMQEKNKVSAKCPCCGGDIKSDKWAWKCENCDFSLNYKIAGKSITKGDLEAIISRGQTQKIKGFLAKSGKKFDAKLVLDKDTKKVNFSFDD